MDTTLFLEYIEKKADMGLDTDLIIKLAYEILASEKINNKSTGINEEAKHINCCCNE